MKILELFAGSRSLGKVAEELGHEVFSVDIENFDNIDLVIDIQELTTDMIPFKPDMIWASPPCTYFSVASIGKHWNKNNTPKTNEARLGVKIVKKTLQIIEELKPKYWHIENPRGKLRKLEFMQSLPRATVSYCQYGDTRMKPTDIFTNALDSWNPKPMCKNYKYDEEGNIINRHCHHESARRGAKTGTQGLKDNYERSKIPRALMLEIIISIDNNLREWS